MITKFNSLWPDRKELIVKENNYWQKLIIPVTVFDSDTDSRKYLKDKNEYYYQICKLSKAKSKLTDTLDGKEYSVGFEVGCFLYPDTDEFNYHIIHCTKYCTHCGTKTWNISKELNLPYSIDEDTLEHANANRKYLENFILNKLGIKNFSELTEEHFYKFGIVF